jgi:hypothetical protein
MPQRRMVAKQKAMRPKGRERGQRASLSTFPTNRLPTRIFTS